MQVSYLQHVTFTCTSILQLIAPMMKLCVVCLIILHSAQTNSIDLSEISLDLPLHPNLRTRELGAKPHESSSRSRPRHNEPDKHSKIPPHKKCPPTPPSASPPSSTSTLAPSSAPSDAPTVGPSSAPSDAPPVGPSIVVYPHDVKYGIPLSVVTATCKPCYDVTYATPTTTADILACKGPYLFVGARIILNPTVFAIGAYGAASEVQQPTQLNTPHLSDGVYWYLTGGYSFGFADEDIGEFINQAPADITSVGGRSRLSWVLDQNIGGYRAGSAVGLDNEIFFRKQIYNCGTLYSHF